MRYLLLLPMVACAGKDWREAVKADTSQAYSAYAAHHRGEPKAEVATRRAHDRAWAEAQAADTSIAYGSYVSAFPQGEHAEEARARGDELAWTEAKAGGDLASLSAYVARYPGSSHAAEAEQLVEKLWYDDARNGASEASWGRYLVRYPEGLWADEAKRERERHAWEQTVGLGSRDAYQAFVKRYPDGTHANEGRAFLAAMRVSKIQPVIVLRESWQPERMRATVLSRIRSELELGLFADLKREFVILPTKAVDPRGEALGHPHDEWGATADVGLLVVEYSEVTGRSFQPSGNATDNTAKVELYAPNSKLPIFSQTVTASTPEKITGADSSVLHTSAVRELAGRARALGPEIESNKPANRNNPGEAGATSPAGGGRR